MEGHTEADGEVLATYGRAELLDEGGAPDGGQARRFGRAENAPALKEAPGSSVRAPDCRTHRAPDRRDAPATP
ncbi:hypothetical protein GCM10010353_31130 [Streptomyces chryseus]|uniref:Uncharacterized protein n=1 Tax=Streptomyces chryseus TaxID=68186 RepID=A0ABQ3DQB3_9ACTN|nr:hypothetical protein GCM10010353_31130 [Streptomyces chryseus]GHA97740.1 hypothetical protein GCM10010346_20740 [Streptomyces chryseus]